MSRQVWTLPSSIVCPTCQQPMAATTVQEGGTEPPAVNYLCRTVDCGAHEFLVHVL